MTGPRQIGDCRLVPGFRQLYAHGKRCELTPNELKLLMILAARGGQVVTYEDIDSRIWPGEEVKDHTVSRTRLACDLRGKLASIGSKNTLENQAKAGYFLKLAPAPPRGPRRWLMPLALIGATALLFTAVCALLEPTDPPIDIVPAEVGPWKLRTASGRVRLLEVRPRHATFSWHTRDRPVQTRWVVDLDGDGELEAVVISLDVTESNSPTGQVRIDRIDASGKLARPAWIDDAPRYGGKTYPSNAWSLEATQTLDWDGDGSLEILVVTTHAEFASLLVIFNAAGERVRTYANAGHIKHVAAVPAHVVTGAIQQADMDTGTRPGVALALSVEFNDSPRSAGIVLLPPGFADGANPVSDAYHRHDELPRLHDAHYVRLLPSLVAQRAPAGHNWPERIAYDIEAQHWQVTTIEEPGGDGVIRTLDRGWQQILVIPTDRFRHKWPELQMLYRVPEIQDPSVASSFEARSLWQTDQWVTLRDTDVWRP